MKKITLLGAALLLFTGCAHVTTTAEHNGVVKVLQDEWVPAQSVINEDAVVYSVDENMNGDIVVRKHHQ